MKDYICMSNISGYETISNLINEGKKQIRNNNEYVNFEIKEVTRSIVRRGKEKTKVFRKDKPITSLQSMRDILTF